MDLSKEISKAGKQPRIVTFSSGHDNWHDKEVVAKRTELIEKAKNGCVNSKYTLMNEPYNIRALVLAGKTII
ncbi:hypothetical protein KAR91_58165 [Candidatus Pacearchaeota archaeon]|nr:hypothetical protein [Candidatus Pacearchaeota archaeon]